MPACTCLIVTLQRPHARPLQDLEAKYAQVAPQAAEAGRLKADLDAAKVRVYVYVCVCACAEVLLCADRGAQ